MYRTTSYGQAFYTITRDGIELDAPVKVIPVPVDRSLALGLRVIGLVYLAIGIYVLFRRWTAPRATHFYLFCLVSFALYALKYTSQLDFLDWTVFWTNIVADSLQPALFLHFALSFPEERLKRAHRGWLLPLIYAPGAALLGLWIWAIFNWQATGLLKHRMDQTGTAYEAVFYVLGGSSVPAQLQPRRHSSPSPAAEMAHPRSTAGRRPFTLFYAVPFLFDLRLPEAFTRIAGFSIIFLPLTFSWAIVRYRLMDTDLIFKRGVAYTLATGLLLGGLLRHHRADRRARAHRVLPAAVREWGLGLAILIVAAVFDPLKRRIQNWVDRVFDRHRYDYRKALVEFGRGLNSETDLRALLDSIVERLPRTLLVSRVAVFLADEPGRLRLAAAHGLPLEARDAVGRIGSGPAPAPRHADFALGFLDFDRRRCHTHIFLENAQQALHLPEDRTPTAALLDLNYYLPCRVQDGSAARTIAVIGLGRTDGRRLPLQRRRGTARIPGQLHRHRAAERQPLCAARRQRSASSSG